MKRNVFLFAMLALSVGIMMMSTGCGVHYSRNFGTSGPGGYDNTSYGVNVGVPSGTIITHDSYRSGTVIVPAPRFHGYDHPYRYRYYNGPHDRRLPR